MNKIPPPLTSIGKQHFLISIIVPVYNKEKYLPACVDSLLRQGLNPGEYEIILFNDGSTDDSWNICQDYAKRFPNIVRCVSQHNQGVSLTRNNGMVIARGEYVYFCDADDYLIDGGLRSVVDRFLTNEIDILSFSSITLDQYVKLPVNDNDLSGEIVYDGLMREFYRDNHLCFSCMQLYRRQWLLNNEIFFTPIIMCEDTLFNLQVAMLNPRIRIVNCKLYRYRVVDGSLVAKRDIPTCRKAVKGYQYLLEEFGRFVTMYKDKDERLVVYLKQFASKQSVPMASRILSSDMSKLELREIKKSIEDKGLVIAEMPKLNFIYKYIFILPVMQFLFQKIFIPFVLPRLRRN